MKNEEDYKAGTINKGFNFNDYDSVPYELGESVVKRSREQKRRAEKVAQGLGLDAYDIKKIDTIKAEIVKYDKEFGLNIKSHDMAAKKAFNVINYVKNCNMFLENNGNYMSEEDIVKNMQTPEYKEKFVQFMGEYSGFPKELNEKLYNANLKNELTVMRDLRESFTIVGRDEQIEYIKENVDKHIDLKTRFKTIVSGWKELFHEKRIEQIPEAIKSSLTYLVAGESGLQKMEQVEKSVSKTTDKVMKSIDEMRNSIQDKLGLGNKNKNSI